MNKDVASKSRSQTRQKSLSPELNEFLHMLSALEGRFTEEAATT
jgi:hypothetical protein